MKNQSKRFDDGGAYVLKKKEQCVIPVQGKINRVKYIPPQLREIINKDQESEARKQRQIEQSYYYTSKKLEPVVKKTKMITTPGKFRAYTRQNPRGFNISEEDVIKYFGANFASTLKMNRSREVQIPAGDYHQSTLQEYPHLCVPGAPELKYHQEIHGDRCVLKSCCSALSYVGWSEESELIVEHAMKKPPRNGQELEDLQEILKICLPKWVLLQRIKKNNTFDYTCHIPNYSIFVGILMSSDDSCNHAISIHDKWIFDANEKRAIPLCKPGLDYCTCDGKSISTFVKFTKGLLLYYKGTKKEKQMKMSA